MEAAGHQIVAAAIALCSLGTAVWLYRRNGRRREFVWVLAWLLLSGHQVVDVFLAWRPGASLAFSSGLLLVFATLAIAWLASADPPASARAFHWTAALFTALWAALSFSKGVNPPVAYVAASTVLIFAGARALTAPRLPRLALAASCLLLALVCLLPAASGRLRVPVDSTELGGIALLLMLGGMIAAAREDGRRAIEENLVALSVISLGSSEKDGQEVLRSLLTRVSGLCGISRGIVTLSAPQWRWEMNASRGIAAEIERDWNARRAGQSAVALVERSGGLIIARDLRRLDERAGHDPDYANFRAAVADLATHGFLALSLGTNNGGHGCLLLFPDRARALTSSVLRVLGVLRIQIALAAENLLLRHDEERQRQHLTFLNRIARIGISGMTSDQMLDDIASEIQRNLNYDHISIGVLNHATKQIELKAVAGETTGVPRHVPLQSATIGRALRNAEMIADGESQSAETLLPGARSVAYLPILHGAQAVGVLNAESRGANAFTEDELLLLRTLSDHLGAVVHNMLLFQNIQQQAITDALTGLKTRRFFAESLDAECKRATRSKRPFSLLMMDMDRFKQVNDTFGHLEGDLVLARIGQIVEQHCRRSNVMARWGGDEFVILLPEAGIRQARILAGRLRVWIAEDPVLQSRGLSASFGLAGFPLHGDSPDALVRAADAALYEAKRRGGNSVCEAGAPREPDAADAVTVLAAFTAEIESGGRPSLHKVLAAMRAAKPHAPAIGLDGERAMLEALTAMAEAVARSYYGPLAYKHSMALNAMRIAAALGLSDHDQEAIRTAAALHDAGFLDAHAHAGERRPYHRTVDNHVMTCEEVLKAAGVAEDVITVLRHHHDAYSINEENTPFGSRVIAVAEAFDTLYTDCSRDAASALSALRALAPGILDPAVVDVFARIIGYGGRGASA